VVQSLSGMNPDAPGSASQYHGGVGGYIPFENGVPQVVTAGFDFIIGDLHAEFLFGMGEPQTSRQDDQHYATLVRIRGELGLSNKPEIVAGPAGADRADFQKATPYRLETVVNNSGAPITYESPLGVRSLDDKRYDVYLFNHRTRSLQLILRNLAFQAGGKELQGFWVANFFYDATGRAQDILLNDFEVYENRIVISGAESTPPAPATAIADMEGFAPTVDTKSPLWDLPGNIEEDTTGVFGQANRRLFRVDRRTLPGETQFLSGKFRFNDVVPLVSFGFDVIVHRDEVITAYSDAHDDVAINLTGGDTIANVDMTIRFHIRGTRSVGNEGDPSIATPQLFVFESTGGRAWSDGFDWETPYRIEVVLNQSGDTITYNTPWADGVTLANEFMHVYLYNLATWENVAVAAGRPVPYVIEAGFYVGKSSPNNVAGTMADIFWKTVPGRPMDLSLDNIVFYENAAVVTDPGALATTAPKIVTVTNSIGTVRPFQPEAPQRFSVTFESQTGLTYGISESRNLVTFEEMRAIIPANSTGPMTTVDLLWDGNGPRFYLFTPLSR
jgi:hypothetical protein